MDRRIAVLWERVETLRQLAARSPSPRPVIAAFVAAGSHLTALHRRGTVHGAFSPDHAMITVNGEVHLCDHRRHDRAAVRCAAPEVRLGQVPTPASDQYSLAAALIEAMVATPVHHAWPAHARRALVRALSVDAAARWPAVSDLTAALTASGRWRRLLW